MGEPENNESSDEITIVLTGPDGEVKDTVKVSEEKK